MISRYGITHRAWLDKPWWAARGSKPAPWDEKASSAAFFL